MEFLLVDTCFWGSKQAFVLLSWTSPLPGFLHLSIDILSELFKILLCLTYSETKKTEDQKEKNNVKLQTRKTNYSTQKPPLLRSLIHCLTTKCNLSIQLPLGGFLWMTNFNHRKPYRLCLHPYCSTDLRASDSSDMMNCVAYRCR